MAHNLEHRDHLYGGSAAGEHLRRIDEHMMGARVENVVVTPKAEEDAILDSLALELLKSELFNHELNIETGGVDIELSAHVTVELTQGSGTGKRRATWDIKRTAPIWVQSEHSVRIVPTSESNRGKNSDLLPMNDRGARLFQDDLLKASILHGGAVGDLEFENMSALHSIVAKGTELRMLALKSILCLKQLSLAYTLGKSASIYGDDSEIAIAQADTQDVIVAARSHRLLVNVDGFPDEYVVLLANLVRAWPFQGLVPVHDDSMNCVYTATKVDADEAFLYTTGSEMARVRTGILMTPDEYWQKLTGLFEYLGGLSQLYEVLRETRGLSNILAVYASLAEKEEYVMTIDYGLTNSAHTVGHIGRDSRSAMYTLVSQLAPSSTNVMLDIILSYMFWNNVHHVVESIGIGCHRLYGEGAGEGSRISSMLKDQLYNLKGPKNELFSRLVPWIPVLVGGGQHLSSMLIMYAVGLAEYRISASDKIKSLTLMPLSMYDSKTDLVSSKWIVHEPHVLNKASKGTHHTRPNNNMDVHRSVIWSEGLGMAGDAIPLGGVLISGASHYPIIPGVIRKAWEDLDGEYRLASVTITIPNATGRPGSHGPAATLFAPLSHALASGPEHGVTEYEKPQTWVTRSSLAIGGLIPGSPQLTDSSDMLLDALSQSRLEQQSPAETPEPTLVIRDGTMRVGTPRVDVQATMREGLAIPSVTWSQSLSRQRWPGVPQRPEVSDATTSGADLRTIPQPQTVSNPAAVSSGLRACLDVCGGATAKPAAETDKGQPTGVLRSSTLPEIDELVIILDKDGNQEDAYGRKSSKNRHYVCRSGDTLITAPPELRAKFIESRRKFSKQ